MSNTKTEELKAYVTVTGIKKRCRKTSRELIKLGYFPLGTTFETIKHNAMVQVMDIMKSIQSADMHLDFITLEKCDGYTSEQWHMFDKRHQKQVLI